VRNVLMGFTYQCSSILFVQDTAGSERYESITRMYFRGAWAAVVCYDLSDERSFRGVDKWITELRKAQEARTSTAIATFFKLTISLLGLSYLSDRYEKGFSDAQFER